MKRTNGLIIIALWTLLLAPLLCGVGMLVHICVCDGTGECHHEEQCNLDPCQTLTSVPDGRADPRDHISTQHDVAAMPIVVELGVCDITTPLPLEPSPGSLLFLSCERTLPLLC